MTKVKVFDRLWDRTDWALFFEPKKHIYVTKHTSTSLFYENFKHIDVKIMGSGFHYGKGGKATAGTISKIIVYYHDDPLIKITNVGQSLEKFYKEAFGKKADGVDALSLILRGGTKFIGENGSDLMPAAPANGKDKVYAGKGNDWVSGDHGDDLLDGGAGFDVLTYQPLYSPKLTPKGAFAGITLDAALGTVTDPWGHHDTISNFEGYQGSHFADVLMGSAASEEFVGNKGNDVIDGRGGIDVLWYPAEVFYGGKGGIDVNLQEGKIRDTFGTVDTVKNVEIIVGTLKDDRFVGDDNNNTFEGFGGKDSFYGGAGDHDTISFANAASRGAINGALVDLSASRITDPDGSMMNQVFGIEDVQGSPFSDEIFGNGVANHCWGGAGNDHIRGEGGNDIVEGGDGDDRLEGNQGDDVVAGGNGDDLLVGDEGHDRISGGAGLDKFSFFSEPVSENSDVVEDFSTGDLIQFSSPLVNIGIGKLQSFRFVLGASSIDSDDRFIYQKSTGELFYDSDGTGADQQVLVAKFIGSPTITADLIFIV